jgi:hypothetical protein
MLKIHDHKGNANQANWEFTSLHSEWLSPITQKTYDGKEGRVGGGEEYFYTFGGNVNYCNHYGKQYRVSPKTKTRSVLWSGDTSLGHTPQGV